MPVDPGGGCREPKRGALPAPTEVLGAPTEVLPGRNGGAGRSQRGCWEVPGGADSVVFCPIFRPRGAISTEFAPSREKTPCTFPVDVLTYSSTSGRRRSRKEPDRKRWRERRRRTREGETPRGNEPRPQRRERPETELEAGAVPSSAEAATGCEVAGRSARSLGDRGAPKAETPDGRTSTGNQPSHMTVPNGSFPARRRDEAPERVVCCPPGASSLLTLLHGRPGLTRSVLLAALRRT